MGAAPPVWYHVRDLDAGRRFYRETLLFEETAVDFTKRWAQLGRGLWIVPSSGVHTIGMLFPIDLIFLGKDKEVLHVEEHVRPFRISKVLWGASSVLELPVYTIYRSGTQVGDRLEIAPVR